MSKVKAIVAFGVPERDVDSLMEAIVGTPEAPAKWVVLGNDVALLGALDKQWGHQTDLVIGHMPTTNMHVRDAVLDILAHERIELASVVWLQRNGSPGDPPRGVLAVASPASLQKVVRALAG